MSENRACRIITGMLIISGFLLAGCQSINWPNGQKQIASKSKSDGHSQNGKIAKNNINSSENSRFEARRYSPNGYRYDFAQVSMFGDLDEGTSYSSSEFDDEPSQPSLSLQQHTFAHEGACFDPAVSPDGKWLAFATTQFTLKPDIYIKPINATAITQITHSPASDLQPAFSPDSKKIAFCSDRTGSWDIFVIDVNGRNLQQLTDDPAPEMHPSFSPDGTKLAYSRFNVKTRQWEIWLLYLDNPGKRKFLASGLFPSFSPKQETIVYQRAKQRGTKWFSIWTITLGADDQPSMPTEIVSAPDRALIGPNWSPDGKKIVYCAVQPMSSGMGKDNAQIWVVESNGFGRMPVSDSGVGCYSPVWCKDGRIFFCSNRGDCENIWSVMPINIDDNDDISVSSSKHSSEATSVEHSVGSVSHLKANSPVQIETHSNAED